MERYKGLEMYTIQIIWFVKAVWSWNLCISKPRGV